MIDNLLDHNEAAAAIQTLANLLGGRFVMSRKRLAAMGFSKKQIQMLEHAFDLEE